MVFLEFEKPIESLYEQLEKVKEVSAQGDVDMSSTIKELEDKIEVLKKEIYSNLSGWERVQLSRHPNRPYTLHYLEGMCDTFTELHGDRNFKDDKAIVGGLGTIDGKTYMFIGHQKGVNTKMRQYRNFGMANPEGYRKALRLMKMAERFDIPVVCLIDTPGAFPGLEAEERGQGEAIARNLYEMTNLQVPIVCFIIGEGASGGALGIGVGDKIMMLENTWYTVISPESCSSILWRSWDFKEQAAEALKLTAPDMLSFGFIDKIIYEPLGGAHAEPAKMIEILKNELVAAVADLSTQDPEERIVARIDKYSQMGRFKEETV